MKAGTEIYIPHLKQNATVITVHQGKPQLVRVTNIDKDGSPFTTTLDILEKGWEWSTLIATILGFVLKFFGRK